MARRSLKPHLNQIRAWVRQGRTDAWIAHQLEVSVQQIEVFKRDNELAPDDGSESFGDDVDLRAEDDALVAAELEAAAAAEAESESEAAKAEDEEAEDEEAEAEDGEERPRRRRRGRRGGRGRRRAPAELQGTFDHGEEGYGLWLDPSVQDDPVYAEHWAGHRPVTIKVEENQIVIRRSGEDDEEDEED